MKNISVEKLSALREQIEDMNRQIQLAENRHEHFE